MSGPWLIPAGKAPSAGVTAYQIARSLRFRSSASAYLSRTFGAATNTNKWTLSCWKKMGTVGADSPMLFSAGSSGAITFGGATLSTPTDKLVVYTSAFTVKVSSVNLLRDPGAHQHIVVAVDTTLGTPANRLRMYVNSVEVAYLDVVYPGASAAVGSINTAVGHQIGAFTAAGAFYLDAYLSDVYFIDGQQLDPSSFGQIDALTGAWVPKAYSGTGYGANGFHLDFSDNSAATAAAIGADRSGMSNLLLFSDDFTNAYWNHGNNAVTTGGQADPFGGTGAYTLVVGAATAFPYLAMNTLLSFTVGQVTTYTVYAKAGVVTVLTMYNGVSNGGACSFNLSLGTVTSTSNLGTGSGTIGSIVSAGGGWWKCSVTTTHGTAGTDTCYFLSQDPTTTNGQGIIVFRASMVNGATVPTELQFTNGTAVLNKNWTPNGISVTAGVTNDSLVDTPTNGGSPGANGGGEVTGNYATLDPLLPGATHLTGSEGNLRYNCTGASSVFELGRANQVIKVATYWEILVPANNVSYYSGLINIALAAARSGTSALGFGATEYPKSFGINHSTGATFYNSSTAIATYAAAAAGSIVMHAYDPVTGKFWMGKDGTWYNSGNPSAGTGNIGTLDITLDYTPAITDATSQSGYINFGQRPFAFAAPSGFKALCTQNLPDPAILNPQSYFDVNLRVGTAAAFNVTGKAFQPDLVWMKGRSGATDHALYDSVRGVQKDIVTNTPAPAETTEPTGLTAFNSDGFSGGALAKINTLGATYVDWMWKKGVVPGVDVVIYTGNAASPRTISHALGVAPRMVIVKRRDAASVSGRVLHLSASATAGASLYLDATNLVTADNGDWNTTVPTASVFTINTNLNVNAALYAAWLFAEVPGFSRFGGFVGAGNADGVFVWCGFRPRWILAKRYDAGDHWYLYDTARSAFNVVTADLNPNGANAEPFQSFPLDILSNGFKWRGTTGPNGGGSIFAAFAERPFKFARAR